MINLQSVTSAALLALSGDGEVTIEIIPRTGLLRLNVDTNWRTRATVLLDPTRGYDGNAMWIPAPEMPAGEWET